MAVFSDNPWLHGSFNWIFEDQSASDGCPPWFNGGEWEGVLATTLTLWRLRPDEPPAQAWVAPLLPGNFLHARFPQFAPSCAQTPQTPDTSSQAFFTTRAFNIWHGATFRVIPTIQHNSIFFASPPEMLFVRLSNETLVVPVVVIHWDGESFLDDAAALFDFIPSREYPPDVIPPVRPPFPPYASPATIDFPPDEIWKQCGIQFQAVKVLHLGAPDSLTCANSDDTCNALDGVCACVGNPENKPDYVRNEELAARLRTALGSEFDSIFGINGLRPVLVQYGLPPCARTNGQCLRYVGKAHPSTTILGDAIVSALVQINAPGERTSAHELGHVLLGQGHSGNTQHLMHDQPGTVVTPGQCSAARQVAAGLSSSYFQFNQRRGVTDPFSLPGPRSTFPAAVPPTTTSNGNLLVCCDIGGGQKIETPAGLCLPPRGSIAADCIVCCNTSGTTFARVDNDACDPGDVAPAEDCNSVCCEFGDHEALAIHHQPTGTEPSQSPEYLAWAPATGWRALSAPSTVGVWTSGVWTGEQAILWDMAAFNESGAPSAMRYDPARDIWSSVSETAAPSVHGRRGTWTGSELVIQGGRYYPDRDVWESMSEVGAAEGFPIAVDRRVVFWTLEATTPSNDSFEAHGAVYDAEKDRWGSPITDRCLERSGASVAQAWVDDGLFVWVSAGQNARDRAWYLPADAVFGEFSDDPQGCSCPRPLQAE